MGILWQMTLNLTSQRSSASHQLERSVALWPVSPLQRPPGHLKDCCLCRIKKSALGTRLKLCDLSLKGGHAETDEEWWIFHWSTKSMVWGGLSYYLILEHNQQKVALVSNSQVRWLGFSPVWSTILATNYSGPTIVCSSLQVSEKCIYRFHSQETYVTQRSLFACSGTHTPGDVHLPTRKPWNQPLGTPTYMLYTGSSRKHLGWVMCWSRIDTGSGSTIIQAPDMSK